MSGASSAKRDSGHSSLGMLRGTHREVRASPQRHHVPPSALPSGESSEVTGSSLDIAKGTGHTAPSSGFVRAH